MAPKVPAMKFKPKADTRAAAADKDDDLVSSFQQQRIDALRAGSPAATASGSAPPPVVALSPSTIIAAAATTGEALRAGGSATVATRVKPEKSEPGVKTEGAPTSARGVVVMSASAVKGGRAAGSSEVLSKALLAAGPSSPTGGGADGGTMGPIALSYDVSALTESLPIKHEDEASAAPKAPTVDDGLAFLRGGIAEADRSRKANDGALGEARQANLMFWQLPLPAVAPTTAPAAAAQPEGATPSVTNPFALVPPGRVGRLVVRKSGRVTLVLDRALPGTSGHAGPLEYDVCVSGGEGAVMCQTLVAIQGASASMNMGSEIGFRGAAAEAGASLAAYELGLVTHKAVCIPRLPSEGDPRTVGT